MGVSVIFFIAAAVVSAIICLAVGVGMIIVHPWLLILAGVLVLMSIRRYRSNERRRAAAQHEVDQHALAILAERREYQARRKSAVEYAKANPTARRRPRSIGARDLDTGHEPRFRPWAGW